MLKRLISTADVFVQNFRTGVIDRMGFGEDAVRAIAPDIIYVSISGFGDQGPFATKPVYDPLIQSVSGLASIQGGSDQERPRLVRTIVPDKLSGVVAAQAITAALLARERTGKGQHVRLSMLDAIVAFLWGSDMGSQTFVGDELPQQEAASFIDLIYQTADGYISAAVQTDREWTALTRALDRPEWLDDPRFKTPALRQKHINERLAMTQEVLLTRPAAEWLERLTAEGVPCAPVLTRTRMIQHPQVVANGIVVETDHPGAGRLRQARPAARFSGTPTADPSRRSGLGRTHRRNPRRARLFRHRHHRPPHGRRGGMIDFYYWPTPNGWKVSIMLEECGLPYRVVPVNISKGDQFKPEFLAISPNNRMPAIVDHDWDGETVSVFESGAILLHLADKSGRFMPTSRRGRTETMEWLFWQVGNLGPMAGQLSHFVNYAQGEHPYSHQRYANEYNRCLGVLERRLEGREYILDEYSIADMASFPWVLISKPLGQALDEFPNVARWREAIKQRPAVQRGVDLGKDLRRSAPPTDEERQILFNQTARHLSR